MWSIPFKSTIFSFFMNMTTDKISETHYDIVQVKTNRHSMLNYDYSLRDQ